MPDKQYQYHPLHDVPPIIFMLGQMTLSGVYLIFFFITYLTFDEQLFSSRYTLFLQSMKIQLFLGMILLCGSIWMKKRFKRTLDSGQIENRNWAIKIFYFFLALLLVALLSSIFKLSLHFLHLILFFLIIIFLWIFARGYGFSTTRPAWNHPTSSGGIIQGTLAIGLGIALFTFQESALQMKIARWLLLLILIRILTLYSRFRFLSKHSPYTRSALKIILGSHIVLFGIRFIFGLIMPLVYVAWKIILSPALPIQPAALMILVGEASEVILFFISSPPLPPENIIPSNG